jgi:hypothetical protein
MTLARPDRRGVFGRTSVALLKDLARVLIPLLLVVVTACKGTVGAPDPGSTHYEAPPGALFVALDGSDSNAGTEASPWLTLQHAVNAAPDGSTIVLRPASTAKATFRSTGIPASRSSRTRARRCGSPAATRSPVGSWIHRGCG